MWWKFAWYKFWGNHQEPFWVLQTTFANPHLERQKLAWTNIRNWLGQKKTSHVLLLQWVQPGLLLLPQANKHVCCWTPKNETLCHILQPPCSRLLSLFDRILEHVENSRLLSAMCFLCRCLPQRRQKVTWGSWGATQYTSKDFICSSNVPNQQSPPALMWALQDPINLKLPQLHPGDMASCIFAHFHGPNGLQIIVFTIYQSHTSLLSHDTKEDREWERNPKTFSNCPDVWPWAIRFSPFWCIFVSPCVIWLIALPCTGYFKA